VGQHGRPADDLYPLTHSPGLDCRRLPQVGSTATERCMVSTDEVRRRICDGIGDAEVDVVDTTGGGDHFDVTVSAPAFNGRGLVEQHRMVYAALGDLMQSIHALSLRTTAR